MPLISLVRYWNEPILVYFFAVALNLILCASSLRCSVRLLSGFWQTSKTRQNNGGKLSSLNVVALSLNILDMLEFRLGVFKSKCMFLIVVEWPSFHFTKVGLWRVKEIQRQEEWICWRSRLVLFCNCLVMSSFQRSSLNQLKTTSKSPTPVRLEPIPTEWTGSVWPVQLFCLVRLGFSRPMWQALIGDYNWIPLYIHLINRASYILPVARIRCRKSSGKCWVTELLKSC